ncbi:hypothetical protein EDD11_004928 [Mortierella claussenii]|nr:hypothetical protein EDD11_004928 [Mortierella claussenii]
MGAEQGSVVSNEIKGTKRPSLETLPLECIQTILENLCKDCHALYSLLLTNKAWFQMVLPFLYKSPMALIDMTWPKLSAYSQVLKKDFPALSPPPLPPQSPLLSHSSSFFIPDTLNATADVATTAAVSGDVRLKTEARGSLADCMVNSADTSVTLESGRPGRSSISSTRRTSTTSSSNGGGGGGGSSASGFGFGLGYAPRTHSRSSSRSSTRSWTGGDAFHHGRNEAVLQKDQRDKLVKRKKTQLLWVLLNCTLSEEEHRARITVATQSAKEKASAGNSNDDSRNHGESSESKDDDRDSAAYIVASSTLLSQDLNQDLDIDTSYFQPMVDYLAHYTHFFHPGLRFIVWKVFPAINDAAMIEWRLLQHSPDRIRELFLESVQLQDMIPLVSKLSALHRIKACHEEWDVAGSILFMKQHNQLFGTVRMMELEAYLPDKHETPMDDRFSDLISQVEHLKVLELAGFESLRAQLDLIPRRELKVLRLNCGTLSSEYTPNSSVLEEQQQHNTFATSLEGSDDASSSQGGRMSVSAFLSRCRQLEELLLDPVNDNMLGWAVQERKEFEAGSLTSVPSSPSSSSVPALAHESPPSLVPLKVLELSGEDSERVAMTVTQAAEAFQDTLEVIRANSYSYRSNRTLTPLSWRCQMPRLQVLKVVGRSNLPLDFRSLQYCPALQILDLSKYSGMRACSEAALLNLKYLTRLEYLGLSSFDHLTDSTLRTILGCMPRLKRLRLAIGDSNVSTLGSSGSFSATAASAAAVAASSASYGLGQGHSAATGAGKNTGSSSRGSNMVGHHGSSSSSSGSNSNGASGTDMLNRSPFAALSLTSSSASASASASSSSASTSLATSPIPFHSSLHSSYNHHYSQASPTSHTTPTTTPIPSGTTTFAASSPYVVHHPSASTGIGNGMTDIASSARSTSSSSLMDRFHLENNYLSLEGILDAIDGLSEPGHKNQLEKLSIVLGKLDFEEHYRRLEQYNQVHKDLEITVYRYAHAV